ncbi:MAG: hypothetical protein IMF19_08645, partial [Proteobacteria bacterium]|nr:hypothetical protein [Pseudomonadota bacterium]
NFVKYLRAIKNSDLPEESKLFAMSGTIIIDGTRAASFILGPELTIKDFEKILNAFRNELDVLCSITEHLRYPVGQDKFDAYKFPETDDPVIRLLISDILDEKPDKVIIKECIEIFKEEKNDKNKIALFRLLYHALNPFAR